MDIFGKYLLARNAETRRGQNMLAMSQVIDKQQRQRKLENVLSNAYRPELSAGPAEGPTRPGEVLPNYPAQKASFDRPGAADQLLASGFIPESMALQGKPKVGFTLGKDQVRYDAQGNEIARGPQELAGAPDVETDPLAPWANIRDPKKRDEARIRFGAKAESILEKMTEKTRVADKMNQDLDRFLVLNEENRTGAEYRLPGAKLYRAMDPGFQEMQGISDRLTPQMRQGMPGAASDRDVAMFRGGTVGVEKSQLANRNIATGLKAVNQNTSDKSQFISGYLAEKGHLRGSEQEWKKYLESNPIFDKDAPKKDYALNENRLSYQEWETSGRPEVPRETKQQGAPKKGMIKNGYIFMGGDPGNPKSWKKQ